MYALLWRILPGSRPWKAVQLLVLLAAVLWLLMYVVFPAIEPHLPLDEVVVG
ncbi:hypothetical protein JK386_04640 [Nocardioides sp. zg-536]|uniref:Uncharacterized protein n=1 Tax=Nocardioides faecalis TaxID=2803858 RepID=A0A938Y4P6_9ACTN|nr:hypothetical protein [Nocardioides faecalis]MBM9459179.1 hypothetical protein [Nocardioides faecalis]MBS4751427.1 hypothetical protein [Nocardioides faecalis]QVI59681.1 hypothetical protein KG111_04875 [Nocardioides faecalis]